MEKVWIIQKESEFFGRLSYVGSASWVSGEEEGARRFTLAEACIIAEAMRIENPEADPIIKMIG